ncbi:tesmin/TSO1-like CXC domain containing protein [Klebsormidium nitens]|uniref:Tesmin/TSO1-like CXC domain containing protein n=1 Tax=Klebsormidium nitens TaxID=105231 RepID=A0A1Y1IHW6_KLENI|nr:tesmin/TSO1-like CXC domain containing protein [Klebsormidium nitens]|eukprot:GAQ90475.1 tesmin/TSO1-like CXC domain containing protein [Klebsormidium nitens]
MDSPERRAPIKPNWDGIMSSPGSAAFMDLCDTLSPIRPVPTFHASTFNELNQIRSPASPNFPTRRLKEKRFANSSAAALLLAATTDEAPKTPGLLKREPLRQTFGRNLSRIGDPSTALFAGQSEEAPASAAASKQVLVVQEGGSVGDCESKLALKGATEDPVVAGARSLPAQQGQPNTRCPPPKTEHMEEATKPAEAKGEDLGAKPESSRTADDGQKASGSKRGRDEPQPDADNLAPQAAAPPAFLKSLKADSDLPATVVVQPPESKRGKASASDQDAKTVLAVPTPNPYNPCSTVIPGSQQAKESVMPPIASPVPPTKLTEAAAGPLDQEAEEKKAEGGATRSGAEQPSLGTQLHRELSFAVKQSGQVASASERALQAQEVASESKSQAILPAPAAMELTPPTPKLAAAVQDNPEVRPRQTRSRTMEKGEGSGSKQRAGGTGIVLGVLPKGKRSLSNRKKSRFVSGGEDSSAAEDAGGSSDDTERTVSADGAVADEGAQRLQTSVCGAVAGAGIFGEDEAGSSPSKVDGGAGIESQQGAAETALADTESVKEAGKALGSREDLDGPAKETGLVRQSAVAVLEPCQKAAEPESARHASPPRSTVLPQLKGVRSPRKGVRRGQETPPKAPANAAPPPGGAKQTEEDVAQLLVDLSEGRTPEKAKRRLIGEEATPTSGLGQKRIAVESAPAAAEKLEGGVAGSGRTTPIQVATAVKVEAISASVHVVSGPAVSCEPAATPRSVVFQDAKNGTSSSGALGGNTGRARRLDFDADAARRQSLTARQDPRLSLEAQGSWPGFSAVQNSPAQSQMYISVANASSTPGPRNGTPQSGQNPPETVKMVVKQEGGDNAWQPGQKRGATPEGEGERAAKRERVSFSDGVYQDAKDASDATAAALSAAMGALSACNTPATCQPTVGRPNPTPVQARPAQAPPVVARPSGGPVWKAGGNERSNLAVTPVAMHNAQPSSWPVATPPGAPSAFQHGNPSVTPGQAKQGYVTPPPRCAQPVVRPQGLASPLVTSAPGVTSAAAPFNPNVAIVPKPLPLPAPVRAAKPLNLARLGAGLSAGTVVRVTPGVGPVPPEHHTHLPGPQSAMPGPTGPPGKRASFPPTQRPQAFTSTRFPGYSHYTPSYQKALPRPAPQGYGAVSMPFGQAQGPPPGMSPAVVQRQKMEAAIERKPAQPDPLSELQLDLDLEMDLVVVHESPPQQPKKPAGTCKRCHCKKSRCLKLYCECFAANVYCTGCDCLDCQNRPEFEDIVMAKKEEIERKDPHAFAPKIVEGESPSPTKGETPASGKHKKGCHCKKSMCQKKYCECFQAGVACTDACRCENCANEFGTKDSHSHGPHCDHAGGGAVEAAGMRSPATPGFGHISIQRTFPGGGKMVAKKQSLDPHGDEISALDFPHHHPTKEKRPETPPKPEPATSAAPGTSVAPATSAGAATSAKGRGRKKDAAKGDLKTVRENRGGAAEQTSSGVFPSISSSPARWSLASPDPSPVSRSYPIPPSPPDRRGSDTTEFLHLPASPSPSFGSGPLLRTGTGVGGTPLSRAKVRSTPLGAVIWNPADMASDPADRRNSGQGVYSPQRTPGVSSSGGMLKLSNLSGTPTPNAVPNSALEKGGASGLQEGGGFDTGYTNPSALTCDESVDMDGQDPLAESFFMEPCDYGVEGDLYTYDPGQMDLPAYGEDVYGEAPKESVPVSPPPKTQRTGPSFVSLKNLSVGSGRQYNEDPDDPSAALLSPQDGKRRRLSAGGRVSGEAFVSADEATPIRISKTGSPTKVMAPAFDWGGSPGLGRMATPGKKSLNLSMLPSLPILPARLSGGEGSGLVAPENVSQE